jgi:hypothetical protein
VVRDELMQPGVQRAGAHRQQAGHEDLQQHEQAQREAAVSDPGQQREHQDPHARGRDGAHADELAPSHPIDDCDRRKLRRLRDEGDGRQEPDVQRPRAQGQRERQQDHAPAHRP